LNLNLEVHLDVIIAISSNPIYIMPVKCGAEILFSCTICMQVWTQPIKHMQWCNSIRFQRHLKWRLLIVLVCCISLRGYRGGSPTAVQA